MLLPALAAAQVRSFAFISNFNDDSVSVIDTSSASVIATITGIESPRGAAVTPDGRRALVVSQGNPSAVAIIDVATLAVAGMPIELPLTDQAETIAITPDGSKAYVTAGTSGTVSVL